MPGVLVPRAPAGLYGRLFWPGPQEVLQLGPARIEGWLAYAGDDLTELRVSCEDKVAGTTQQLRPPREPLELPVPGGLRERVRRWSCAVDLSGLAEGEQRLDVEVLLDGAWVVLDSVCIRLSSDEDGDRPVGGFGNLPDGVAVPRGSLVVTGIASHRSGPVRAVVLNLDGVAVARSEVFRQIWSADIDLREAEGTMALLTVDALLPDDRWVRLDSSRIRLLDGV